MAVDLCLQALKYSHIDSLDASGKSTWNHVQHNDLFVLVKGHETNGPMTMTIISGNTKLETIDIGKIVNDALSGRREAESRGKTVRTEQLPIFGITRDTSLALRYRLHNEITRRIQLKLQNATDCSRLVATLQRRGMEIEDRPGTARPNTSTKRPETSHTDFRPLTAQAQNQTQSSSPFFGPGQQNDQYRQRLPRPSTGSGNTMRPPIRAPSVQDEEDLYGLSPRRPAHNRAVQASDGYGEPMPTLAQEATERQAFARDESMAPPEVGASRPTTSQLLRSHTTQPSQITTYNPQQAAVHGMERPSSASHTGNLDSIRQAFEDRENSSNAGSERPYSAIANQEHWPSVPGDSRNAAYSSSGLPGHRPLTAASGTSLTTPDIGKQSIGLQMEDTTKRPSSSNNLSRPSSSALELPPLKRPTLIKETSASSGQDSHAQPTYLRPGSAAIQNQSAPIGNGSARPGYVQPPEQDLAKLAPSLVRAEDTSDRRLSPSNQLFSGPRPLTERSNNIGVPRITSYTDAPHELESPPASAYQSSRPSGAVPAQNDALARVSNTINAEDSGTRDLSLDKYAAQSRSDREATLADFMIENLENPAFATLCEDVENCWQRIALGL